MSPPKSPLQPPSPSPTLLTTHIPHLSRLLQTTPGLDATLSTLLFTTTLLHSQLLRLLSLHYARLAGNLIKQNKTADLSALQTLPTPPTRLAALCASVQASAVLFEDLWTTLRLFSLVHVYAQSLETWRRPHRDPLVKTLTYASLAAGTAFQILENVAVLAQKGVIPLPADARVGKDGKVGTGRGGSKWLMAVANRFWMCQVLLEAGRLMRVRGLGWREELGAEETGGSKGGVEVEVEGGGGGGEGMVKSQSVELERKWTRQFYANAGWFPLTLHWSYVDGADSPVREVWRGLAGLVPSLIALGDVWRETG